MQPLVSVCVLTWNHENYIVNCLQSIVEQDYTNIEIIYLDNCSTDKTYERATGFLANQPIPAFCFKNKTPLSIPVNDNFLISKAEGKYICLISGDDWMAPGNIKAKVVRMLEDEAVAVVYSEAYTYIESEDRIIKKYGRRSFEGYVFDELVRGNIIVAPGVLVDIDKVKEVGGFNERVLIEDWDLWLRLSQRYKVAYIPEHLVYYRRHNNNASSPNSLSYLKNVLAVLDQYKGHKYYRESRETIIKGWVYESVLLRSSLTSFKVLIKNFRLKPFYFKQMIKIIFGFLKGVR